MFRQIAAGLVLGCWLGAVGARAQIMATSSVQYLRLLDQKKAADQSDLVRVVAMFLGNSKLGYDYDASLSFLDLKGMLDDKYPINAEKTLDRGTAAYYFARSLGCKGGWLARLVGLNRRTAYKDLVAKGYMLPHGTHTPMSGADLLGVMRLLIGERRRGML